MRLLNAHFIGLKGIYNKSRVKEISIDFTKCIHNMVMIIGKNGYGKSTLIEVLNPLPDTPSMYLDGMDGLKEISYIDNGDVYKITIRYPITSNGQRGQTKAFIQEIHSDGSFIELNPNGNIGSFKEVLYSRFNLDPSFMSLSKLSIENRGIVDKKPSERKKYVALQLESTEVYNDMYKALVKRSGVFNSMINSISSKIDSIGTEEKLNLDMQSLTNRLDYLSKQKNEYTERLSKAKATIELIDPSGAIKVLYSDLVQRLDAVSKDLETVSTLLSNCDVKSEEDALKRYKNIEDSIMETSSQVSFYESKLRDILIRRDDEMEGIRLKQKRVAALSVDVDADEIKRQIINTRKSIFECEKKFKEIGLENFEITKDEYVTGLNTLNDLRDIILRIKSYASLANITIAVDHIRSNTPSNINALTDKKTSLESELASVRESLQYYNGLASKLNILVDRPDGCNIDSCAFIKDAIDAQKQLPQEHIDELSLRVDSITSELITVSSSIDTAMEINKIVHDIEIVCRMVRSNSALLRRLPNGDMFYDQEKMLDRISAGDNFNDIYDLYNYIDYGNMLEIYKAQKNSLESLEQTYKLHKEKAEILDSLTDELNSMMEKMSGIENEIQDINDSILELNKQLVDYNNEKSKYSLIIDRFKQVSKLQAERSDISARLATVEANVAKISEAANQIRDISGILEGIDNEITPKQRQLDSILFSLAKLKEYQEELAVYRSKVELIELIKKYSSPTKGGIQMVFMQLYMGSTLKMANELLSSLFDGQLELLPYVITEDEFRIPCRNVITSVVNDDISSCSSAERFMISMIISFTMLYQSSTKYNILEMDEVDSTLDQENKSMFPYVVNSIRKAMGIEMCIMVSHSSEIDMSDVDIISLSPTKEPLSGNVIFSLY